MPLQRFIPSSSDRYISNDKNQGAVKFGHLNAVVDYINENGGGGSLALYNDDVFSGSSAKFIVDKNNTLSNLAISAGETIKFQRPVADNTVYGGYIRQYYYNDGGGQDLVNGALIGSTEWWGRYNNSFTRAQFKLDVYYNGDGVTRRGRACMAVAESSGYGHYQFVMTQYDKQKICIMGHGASTYIDDAIDPNVAYNIHAGNIINTGNGSLDPLAIDVNGNLLHKFYGNGNITFGEKTDQGARVFIKGSGATSATTSLLVKNSSGTQLLKVTDDGEVIIPSLLSAYGGVYGPYNGYSVTSTGIQVGGSANASAILQANSTTKGFLPPRMTTAEKTAISTPAAGLVVYDNTLNQLSYFNGSTWVNV